MVVRVTVEAGPDITLIRVDGRLAGAGVWDFERECRTARRPVVLDLTHLTSVDAAALDLLRGLTAEGVHALGASPYIAMLMGGTGSLAATARPARRRTPGASRSPRGRAGRDEAGDAGGGPGRRPRRDAP